MNIQKRFDSSFKKAYFAISLSIVTLMACQTTRTLDILYVMADVLCSVRFM